MRAWLQKYPNTFLAGAGLGSHWSPQSSRYLGQRRWLTLGTIAGSNGEAKEQCTYKATVAYDGTAYKGFQLQNPPVKGKITIQGEIEKCLNTMFLADRRALRVHCAGRTDSGVHARGQVVSFCAHKRDLDLVRKGMNCLLPDDIRIVDLQEAAHTFSARHSATGKIYAYMLDVGAVRDPFMLRYSQYVWRPVNVQAMRDAAQEFVGRHDFTHFANTFPDEVDPVKTIRRITVTEPASHLIRVEVEGSGFLYRMVRHMVGALVAIGTGLMEPSVIPKLLNQGSSQLPGQKYRGWSVAEAQGLILEKVFYDEEQQKWQDTQSPVDGNLMTDQSRS